MCVKEMEAGPSCPNLGDPVRVINSCLIYERVNKVLDTASLSFQMSPGGNKIQGTNFQS